MQRSLLPGVLADLDRYGHLSLAELEQHQLARLRALVTFHHEHNAPYRSLCQARGVAPSDIRSLSDLARLPIIERDFLAVHGFHQGPGGALSVPHRELGTFLNSSGSTGKPKRIPIAAREIQSIFETSAMGLWIAGVRGHNIAGGGPILPIFPHGPFPGSFFVQNGSEVIGFCPKADMGLPFEWHLQNLVELGAKYIVTSPSFISAFANYADERVDLRSLSLDRIVLGGEYFSEAFRRTVEDRFGTKVRDIYGCAETQVVALESDVVYAEARGYLYHLAYTSILEVVEPGSDRLLPPGEEGEMVITVLNRWAWPVVRYRMGDIIALHPKGNPLAGREYTFPMLSRIRGRADDMLIYGNVNLYPETFFGALARYNAVSDCPEPLSVDKFRFEIQENDNHDARATLTIEREKAGRSPLSPALRAEIERRVLAALTEQSNELRHALYVGRQVPAPSIAIVEAQALYVKEQKLRRMLDRRRR